MSSTRTLAVDTTGSAVVVALADDSELIADWVDGTVHAQALLTGITQVLADAAVTIEAVTTLAITIGPGSFTAARVGVATANGIVQGLARTGNTVTVVTMTSLASAACSLNPGDGTYTVCVDAQRGEYYTQDVTYENAVPTMLGSITTAKQSSCDGRDRCIISNAPTPHGLITAARTLARPADGPLTPLYVRDADAQPVPTGGA